MSQAQRWFAFLVLVATAAVFHVAFFSRPSEELKLAQDGILERRDRVIKESLLKVYTYQDNAEAVADGPRREADARDVAMVGAAEQIELRQSTSWSLGLALPLLLIAGGLAVSRARVIDWLYGRLSLGRK